MVADWISDLRSKLIDWKGELAELDHRPVDKQAIFNSARNKVTYLLRRAAASEELLPDSQNPSQATRFIELLSDRTIGLNDAAQENQTSSGVPKRFYIGSKRKRRSCTVRRVQRK